MSHPEPERTPTGWEPPSVPPSSSGPFDPPPAPPPGPGWGPGPPVERRRRRWPWILAGVILAIVLGIGGCTFVVFRAARPSIDAANEWLALVDEGRYGEAYGALCPAVRGQVAAAEAEAELAADFGAGIDAYRLSSYQNTNGNVTVGGTVTIAGEERSISLAMGDDSGEWRVCRYGFQALSFD